MTLRRALDYLLLQCDAGVDSLLNRPMLESMDDSLDPRMQDIPTVDESAQVQTQLSPSDLPTLNDNERQSLGKEQIRPLRPGQMFGSYHLLRLIGQGGFGQVWEAEHVETQRRLALKLLIPLR